MILYIFRVAWPIFQGPDVKLAAACPAPVEPARLALLGAGPYLEQGFALDRDGSAVFFDLTDGRVLETQALAKPGAATGAEIVMARRQGADRYALFWDDGSATVDRVGFATHYDSSGKRVTRPSLERLTRLPPLPGADPRAPGSLRINDRGATTLARAMDGGRVLLHRRVFREGLSGELIDEVKTGVADVFQSGEVTALAMDRDGRRLLAGSSAGELAALNTADIGRPSLIDRTRSDGLAVASIEWAFGEFSAIVGDRGGGLAAWHLPAGRGLRLQRFHEFTPHRAPVRAIVASHRDKSFLSLDDSGQLFQTHLTSERRLLELSLEGAPIGGFALAERGAGLLAADRSGGLRLWTVHAPHPEVSWRALWGKTWYEGYPEPAFVWQSSSANDDFEPKLSLIPLIFGTLKGVFYGMLFSFPLAIMAALYVSHLMRPRWRLAVKPVIELMAAAPTVAIGFLAALWLAPKVERNLLGVLLAMAILPAVTAAGVFLLLRLKRNLAGYEFLWAAPIILAAMALAYWTGGFLRDLWFGGNFNLWLFQTLDLDVDQRNCLVVSFALGFAVAPIIFTISEDALYNVPKNMTAAAMALGSSRWQTLRRVVMPLAAPGIFAAAMIGFGRAIGETMIVLMATGNTPILSPSFLNGMRALSANIAVEIPEAPAGGTLFRVLFLSAALLFIMTFCVNTLAEAVRHRLRKKYRNL